MLDQIKLPVLILLSTTLRIGQNVFHVFEHVQKYQEALDLDLDPKYLHWITPNSVFLIYSHDLCYTIAKWLKLMDMCDSRALFMDRSQGILDVNEFRSGKIVLNWFHGFIHN